MTKYLTASHQLPMKRSAPLSPMASYLPPRSLSPSQVPAARVLHRRLMIDSNSSWASGSALWEDGKYNGKMVGTAAAFGMSLLKLRGRHLASKFATSDGVKDRLTNVLLDMSFGRILWRCSRAKCRGPGGLRVRWVILPLCLQTLINWIVTLLCPGSNPSHLQGFFDDTEHPPANATLKLEFLDSQT